jgi:hypothetical protein
LPIATTESVRRAMVAKAEELGLSMVPRDIRITRKSPIYIVEVDYVWPIDMWIYRHVLRFHFSEQGEFFENDRH